MNTPHALSMIRPVTFAVVAGIGLALLAGNLILTSYQAKQTRSLSTQLATFTENVVPLREEVAKLRATVELVSADSATLLTTSGAIQVALEKIEGQVSRFQQASTPSASKPTTGRHEAAQAAAVNNLRALFRSLVAQQWLRNPVLGRSKPVELMVGMTLDGSISSVTVVSSSGSSEFDRSVAEAIHRVDHVPGVRALDRDQYERHFAIQRYAFSANTLADSLTK